MFENWRKSIVSFSNGACVEVADGPDAIGIRDSQLGLKSPILEVSSDTWMRFTAKLRSVK